MGVNVMPIGLGYQHVVMSTSLRYRLNKQLVEFLKLGHVRLASGPKTIVCCVHEAKRKRLQVHYLTTACHHSKSSITFNSSTFCIMSSDMQLQWRRADCVCFDVDSTVIIEEGIDELANFCNKGTEVANLTSKAMSGSMTFQESLKLRLDIIQPSLMQLTEFIRKKPPTLTPGIKKLMETLQQRNVPIYLISGGFKSIISPIAQQLDIPETNIYANCLKFDSTGEYAGFDENQPTSKSGGKGVVINILKSKYGFNNLFLIGDGATDLEACPPADGFIGYGGNVVREAVRSKAKWYVTDFKELIKVLNQ